MIDALMYQVEVEAITGCLYPLQMKRGKDLKLVIMSATLDAAKFVQYFPAAKAAYLQVLFPNASMSSCNCAPKLHSNVRSNPVHQFDDIAMSGTAEGRLTHEGWRLHSNEAFSFP